ncbi:hypothetical protein SAMN05216553_101697 [Lentzea fradiae]|uniref:Uncharacterized protein n=1 Tax=Lentzea fradiae TaxID=200378 RepID=A0A1G7L6C6_9PSEU|nr:hypothetical protein SAMN05216553_101697 [Lentzea fradiae]
MPAGAMEINRNPRFRYSGGPKSLIGSFLSLRHLRGL